MQSFAALKSLGRIGQNKDRHWASHIRYEWLASITCLTTTTAKKKLFGGAQPAHTSKWFRGQLRFSNGKVFDVTLGEFRDVRLESLRDEAAVLRDAAEFQANLETACRGLGLGWSQTQSTVRDIVGGTEAQEVWTLDENAYHSIPAELVGAD